MNPPSEVADEMVRQLAFIRNRLRAYPEGHGGLQLAAAFRMADLMRAGRWDDIKRIAGFTEGARERVENERPGC